ncbi:para-aminobenzoate synthase component I [Proteus mirabilis]|nr:para-aminobenzoate synthase component I [Proteus mirabilis]
MDTNISIRTLLTEKNKIYCWAGGGIVADSVAEQEYQETFDKLGQILTVLSEVSPDDTY